MRGAGALDDGLAVGVVAVQHERHPGSAVERLGDGVVDAVHAAEAVDLVALEEVDEAEDARVELGRDEARVHLVALEEGESRAPGVDEGGDDAGLEVRARAVAERLRARLGQAARHEVVRRGLAVGARRDDGRLGDLARLEREDVAIEAHGDLAGEVARVHAECVLEVADAAGGEAGEAGEGHGAPNGRAAGCRALL